jgi:raffinose/stachyose/melibiose transport system substrate-binding protein
MNRLAIIRLLVVGALGLGGAWFAYRGTTREALAADEGRIVLRFTHDMLHASVRRGFANVIADYQRLHPQVDIHIIEVPGRMFRAWRKTRLLGRTPPDILRLGDGLTTEELARFFVPLSRYVELPNPYNTGTPLEGVPWRETFVDGLTGGDSMDSAESYSRDLMEIYGVSVHSSTTRLYCNLDLLERITGTRELPVTLEAFLDVCAQADTWARRENRAVTPIVAGQDTPVLLLLPLMQHQTQRLSFELNRQRTLTFTPHQAAVAYSRGEWAPDRGPVADGWRLLHEVGRYFQPSFLQAQRDDASFMFLQQRGLFAVSGTFDAYLYLGQDRFDVGVVALPEVTPDHPRYGHNILGPRVESVKGGGGGTFGILKDSPHFEQALDFLRYLTSQPVNRTFARDVQRIPLVVGVETPPEIAAFAPRTEGLPNGFSPVFMNFGSREVQMAFTRSLYLLLGPSANVDAFMADFARGFTTPLRRDLEVNVRQGYHQSQRTDSAMIATMILAEQNGDADHAIRAARLMENQNLQEAEQAQLLEALNRLP